MDYFKNLTTETFWSDILETVIMAIVSIGVLFILTKLMGKKQISQLSFFEIGRASCRERVFWIV